MPPPPERSGAVRGWAAASLLALPVVGLAWVPAYARERPRLGEVPFFYWYQLAWVGLSIACMAGAAVLLRSPARSSDRSPDAGGSA
jgi:Protein of unknown function (DUF3311)